MSASQNASVSWKNVPTRTVKGGDITFAYRELGAENPGIPLVCLIHLAAVLDNWDPRVIDGLAATHHVVTFDNRGIGASSGSPANSIEQMARDAITFIKAMGFKQVDLFGFSMGGMIAQEIVLMEPQLIRKMIITGTGPAGGEGISKVGRVTYYDILRGYLTFQDPKQFLFFTRTQSGISAGKEFLARLKERAENRDKEITVRALLAQLKALRRWGTKKPVDLSVVRQPVLVANGDNDRMVPTANTRDLARRLPNSELVIYPDSGHGAVFQFHADFVLKALAFLARPHGGTTPNRADTTLQQGSRSMKALTFSRYAKRDNIAYSDIARPTPKPHELLVQVHAVGLNPVDLMILKGEFKSFLKFNLPATIGSDLAGVVIEVGSQVTRFKPGDAVFASTFDSGGGSLAEFAVVAESAAALKPARLDFVQAASIPMVGLTSWQALKERACLKAGQKVFIPAGSGGIGTFAIQLAKHLGAKVGTTTSTANIDLVRSLGADEVVDYKKQEFEDVLRDYDAVLGTVKGDALEKSLRILKPGSIIVSLVGPPDVAFARKRGMNFVMRFVFAVLSRKITRLSRKRGATYSFLFGQPNGGQLAQIGALLDAGSIKPVIDKVFPFEQAKEALAYLEQGRAKGKVVVQVR